MAMERRLFSRFLMSGKVIVQPDPAGGEAVDCELIDLSYGGVGLYIPRALVKGSQAKFLVINRQLNVNLGGLAKVIFCNPTEYNGKAYFRAGFEFLTVDREQVQALLMRVRDSLEHNNEKGGAR